MATKERDRGYRRIRRELKRLNGLKITAGIHPGAGEYPSEPDQDPIPVAVVAFWNEFGTIRAPARPFIRTTVDQNLAQLKNFQRQLIKGIVLGRGMTAHRAADAFGQRLMFSIQNTIKNSRSWAEPNAPTTVAQKLRGGALFGPTPLIRSGLMMRSVTYQVGRFR